MNTILTKSEREEIFQQCADADDEVVDRYGRAVEAVVLAKLREQEPVAHRYRFGDVWMFDTYRWNGQDADEVVPVYEHPNPRRDEHSPCMGTNCGKTRYDQEHSAECIAETAKSQGWDTHATTHPADAQSQQLAVLLDVRNSIVNNRCDGDTDFANGVEAANRNLLVRIDHMIKRTRQGYTHPVKETHAAEWPFAATEAPAQADRQRVPDGHVLVPVEPTPEMVRAVGMTPRVYARKVWAAMLAAAPEAPAQASAVDERAAFEAELRRQCFQKPTTEARDLAWCMWQARAALAQKGGAA